MKKANLKPTLEEYATFFEKPEPHTIAFYRANLADGENFRFNHRDNWREQEKPVQEEDCTHRCIYRGLKSQGEGDYKKAVEFFSKAADMGDAEGMFNLGRLKQTGKGCEVDLSMALELYKTAAACPPYIPEGMCNPGVAAAELAIGYMYQLGIGVEQNFVYAAEWFKKSSDHGLDRGALAMAFCYQDGEGVEKNIELAVQYFKLASLKGNAHAMDLMSRHFAIDERDPARARLWHRCALQNDDSLEEMSEDLLAIIEMLEKKNPIIDELEAFEANHGLSKISMTFYQRLSRMKEMRIPLEDEILPNSVLNSVLSIPEPLSMMTYLKSQFDTKLLNQCVLDGSETAHSVIKAVNHFIKGLEIMEAADLGAKEKAEIVHEFAEGIRTELSVVMWVEHEAKHLNCIVNILLANPIGNSDLENDVRVCYVVLQNVLNTDDNEMMNFLKESINKFPDEVVYYRMYISELTKKKQCSMQEINKALTVFPNDLELLSYKRLILNFEKPLDIDAVIKITKEFIAKAPSDHRDVPECYYHIAWLYLTTIYEIDNKFKDQMLPEIKEILFTYYKLGLVTEENQLPCWLPRSNSKKCAIEKYMDPDSVSTILPQKNYFEEIKMKKLMDICRVDVILAHRRQSVYINSNLSDAQLAKEYRFAKCFYPKFKQISPASTSGLKPITFQEILPMEQLYEGRVIKLTNVEDALIFRNLCRIVGEDKNGDVLRVDIYNLKKKYLRQDKVGFGCKISIMNPFMYFGSEESFSLRVDDGTSVFLHLSEREESRCRFCGRDADKQCAQCKRVMYCSTECQRNDWKIMKHKVICKPYYT